MKKWLLWVLALSLLSGCTGGQPAGEEVEEEKLHIVTTVFPAYDFARAAGGELAEVEMLLPPGTESHSYEPTPADILAVQNCDLFIFLGGESDDWVNTILEAAEPGGQTLRMLEHVELLEEESVEGMEEPGHSHEEEESHLGQVVEMDEHVWTDPENAAVLTRVFGQTLAQLDPDHQEVYLANAEAYAEKLEKLDEAFASFFSTLSRPLMIFGDRFPLRYFAQAYGIEYYAAFPGCSTQTEPSAATVAFLTEKVREEQVSTVWYIEFSNHLVADSIAEAAGAETAMFHSCHNVSPQELEAGETYFTLMEKNLRTLQEQMKE